VLVTLVLGGTHGVVAEDEDVHDLVSGGRGEGESARLCRWFQLSSSAISSGVITHESQMPGPSGSSGDPHVEQFIVVPPE